ncbi:hypothetical protein GLOTRDRAFT_93285 [Gloeophyllum trabeum ATCC 11539]|uniref:Uncharacterized protein n=1 Tax=Gloeophyllum trabeum (strain ATCC 11539 / FP-39264 / Madison 617) TaxID=670483 RepID=S7Q8E4_GLOTA|nr:uncharacterized protein GLOTRDRAFT_93285 [Gloeophyllum trabeum ATCC 11539]EPQ55713.1 hypothetical protein GLOTRDRAFT_93285 [Gloeophyllum trabeum ATCC 11539]
MSSLQTGFSVSPTVNRANSAANNRYEPYPRVSSAHRSFSDGLGSVDKNTIPPSQMPIPGTPHHPSGARDIEHLYPTFTPRTGGAPLGHSNSMNMGTQAYVTSADIDRMVNDHGLLKQRDLVHRFNEMAHDERLLVLFCSCLHASNQNQALTDTLAVLKEKLNTIEAKVDQGWQPADDHEAILKGLLRHYIIQPQYSYSVVPKQVGRYIFDHADKVRLRLYVTDATIRTRVDQWVNDKYNEVKSGLRKAVWTSITNKVPLDDFASTIVKSYHLPVKPKEVPQAIMGSLALMRDVAAPLTTKKGVRGGDTGFWKALEARLAAVVSQHGTTRDSSEEWKTWEKDIIEKDIERYQQRSVSAAPALQVDLNASLVEEMRMMEGEHVVAFGDSFDMASLARESMSQTKP